MALENVLLHLETRVPGLPVLRILGVQHGVRGIYHLARFDHAYFTNILKEHPSEVLSEGLTETLVVPSRFNPSRLEPVWVQDVPAVKRVVGAFRESLGLQPLEWFPFTPRRVIHNFSSLLRRAAAHVLLPVHAWLRRPDVLKSPLTERQEMRVFEDAQRHSGIAVSDVAVTDKVRSLFMAATALHRLLISHPDKLAVAGVVHASTIHRFIENPDKALDYIDELRGKLRRNPEFLEGVTLERLQEAEDVFRRHPTLV